MEVIVWKECLVPEILICNSGLIAIKDNLSEAYINDPELEADYLVFGYSIGF